MFETQSGISAPGALSLKQRFNFEINSNLWWNQYLSYTVPTYEEEFVTGNAIKGSTSKLPIIKPNLRLVSMGIMYKAANNTIVPRVEIAIDGTEHASYLTFSHMIIGGVKYNFDSTSYADESHNSGIIKKGFTMCFFDPEIPEQHIINPGEYVVQLFP